MIEKESAGEDDVGAAFASDAVARGGLDSVGDGGHDASDWEAIVEALRGLRFGVVSVVVQDGVVVQIDRTEKRRVRRRRP